MRPSRALLVALITLTCAIAPSAGALAASIDDDFTALQNIAEGYPPKISTKEEKSEALARYKRVKLQLDKDVKSQPGNKAVILKRAMLESFGHNMDVKGAFEEAEKDFVALLKQDPNFEPAMLPLARMWVNTNPVYAPRAEKLFRAVQCRHGAEPVEEAQRGLFFALYYQGRMTEAKALIEYLSAHWPRNEMYRRLLETTNAVLAKQGVKDAKPEGGAHSQGRLASCE
jgi:tetratricopeptide (TPR) repeat protein